MSRHVLFAVVSYSTQVEWDTTMALHAGAHSLGCRSSIICAKGMAELCRARNGLFATFVASGATDMLCVDSDVGWAPGSVERIMSHPVDLVFGAYPRKADGPPSYSVRGFSERAEKMRCVDPVTGEDAQGGLIQVQGGPAGFLRITKKCADELLHAYGNRWAHDEAVPGGKAWQLFEAGFSEEEHLSWSEDIEFCRKYTAIGGKVWLDPWLTFEHYGKKVYRGCIGHDSAEAELARVA